MCGIAGYVLRGPSSDLRVARTLLSGVRSRGPDDEGIFLADRAHGHVVAWATEHSPAAVQAERRVAPRTGAVPAHDLALLHARYAIVDLSAGGHQPFRSRDRAITAVFNGEIYNYIELRRQLEAAGTTFHTASDTEVLVEGYRHWGDSLWSRLNGFWAVALYDHRSATLVLSRDRMGVAPLYVRETEGGLFFASTIRPLIAIAPASIRRDNARVLGFIETGMKDLDDATLYREIRSLPAATTVRVGREAARLEGAATMRFWTPPTQRLTARDLSLDEAATELRDRLFDAVALRLRADVEVACELSGGMDSSSVVAAAASLLDRPITTFTVKVPEQDEEPIARTMLGRYRLDYRVMLRPERDFLGDATDFTALMEEPYHSPNIYTHFQMRRSMKADGAFVVLAGAGGDEVLAGYEHLFWPRAGAELCDAGLREHVAQYDRARGCYKAPTLRQRLNGRWWRARATAIRAAKRLLGRPVTPPVLAGLSPQAYAARYPSLSFQQQQLFHQRVAMLPYYLRSNDHFTMEIPIEARYPFLDYRIVELGLQLPIQYLFHDGWTKYVLRRAMEKYLPDAIVWRREKMGFPFDYRGFLAANRSGFEGALGHLEGLGVRSGSLGTYDSLVNTDPMKLWRLCSTALWIAREEIAAETAAEAAA